MANSATHADRTISKNYIVALITAAVVIAALYFGRQLFVPLAVSILFSFLLSTPLLWLEKHRLPRPLAVAIVLAAGISVLGALFWLGVNELGDVARDWPQYQANISRKVQAIRGAPGKGIQNIERTFSELKQDLSSANPASAGQTNDKPVPVKLVNGGAIMSSLGFAGETIAEFLAELFAVFVLTLFILLNREQLRNRIIRLFGQGRLVVVTTTFDEAAYRVSRFLLSQFSVNACFGLTLFIGLRIIGVPYAPLWGAFVLFLRFVPYVGTIVAGLCPVVMSLAAFEGWQKPVETLVLYMAIELSISSFIEPWLYANRTGISPVAYLLSAAFWTLLWGPIGLVLSTPMTVCLVVMGRHLPPLEFLYVLLGDEPVLPDEVHFYQRLLAEDEDEASLLLEAPLKSESLAHVLDHLLIPALTIAERDRHEGRLAEQKAQPMYEMAREIAEVAAERHACANGDLKDSHIVCLGSRDQADELIASVLVQMLRQCGATAELKQGVDAGDDFVLLSALPPFAIIHARTVCKRIHAAHPKARILLGVWGSETPAQVIQERLGSSCADWVGTSVEEIFQILSATTEHKLAEQAEAAR